MAKSKKSKILAMALCASVMTGIYAAPVMAEDLSVTLDGKGIVTVGSDVTGTLTIAGTDIATALTDTELTLDSVTANTISNTGNNFFVGADGKVSANSVTTTGDVVAGTYSLKDIGVRTQNMTATEGNTAFTGNVSATGTLTAGDTTLANTTVDGTLEVTGDTTLAGLKAGATTVDGTLEVTGDTTLAGLTAGATTVDSLTVNTDKFVVDADGNTTVGGTLNVTGKSTLKGGLKVIGNTETDTLNVNGAATVDSLEVAKGIEAANGKFQLTEAGVLTVNGEAAFTKGATVNNGLSVTGGASVDGNFAVTNGGLSVSGGESVLNGGLTVNNGDTKLNGKLDVGAGNFKVDTAGNTEFNGNLNIGHNAFEVTAADGSFSAARDKFNVFADGSFNAASENFKVSADGVINADSLYLQTYGGGTLEVGEALQALTDAKLPDKVGGIERDPAGAGDPGNGTTTIEGMAKFDSEGMTVGDTVVADSKITVGAEGDQTIIKGGAITAKSLLLDGKDVGKTIFGIERDPENEVTTIEGVTSFDANGMSIKNAEDFGTSLGVAGMEITATGGLSTRFTAGGATFVGASGTTTIDGGAIETTTINGVEFTKWHDEVDGRLDKLEYKTQNIKPGTGEGGASGLTGGEDTITVPDTAPGHTGITGDVTVGGEINAGEIVVGDKGSDNKTTIDGGNVTVNGGENGSTTINGGNITTGDTTITTIDGTGINTVNGNFTGDVDVDGEVTVGDGTTITGEGITTGTGTFDDVIIGENTTIDSDGIKTNDITAGTGNIGDIGMAGGTINTGNTTINGSGMTVGTDENATSITNDTVKAQNGDFDNLTAGSGTFGTGNNKTVINNDGVNVGGTGGTSIKHDEVRVGADENGQGGSYMNDTDVVSGEGVSLNDTAERVGHLENRVGELEDRIDKVGAMSAAIANLRTMGYDPAAPTEIAVGVGQYRSETGVALGMFHYPNKDFMLSLSVSTSGDEVMGGIGATWKFGRKSPEKVLAAEKEKAAKAKLAKAEAMKKAAKEAKIKAQQERHAKLAAERAAQAEAAK